MLCFYVQPVQSKADRYARKIQVSVKRKEEEEDDQQQPSIGEQANMLQVRSRDSEWHGNVCMYVTASMSS